jgi:hypothetical protein
VPQELRADLEACADLLYDYFIVSSVILSDDASGDEPEVTVAEHPGAKCPRCWKRTDDPVTVEDAEGVCRRCAAVLEELSP